MRYAFVLRAGAWSREKYPDLKDAELITTCGHRHTSFVQALVCSAIDSDPDLDQYGLVEECPAHQPMKVVSA